MDIAHLYRAESFFTKICKLLTWSSVKLKIFKLPALFFALFFFILSNIFSSAAGAGDPARILLLPFAIHAEKDLSFLNPGIMGMLSSRLSAQGRVTVIKSRETALDEQAALTLARELDADYLIIGSLTVFGSSVSTDARFLEVSTGKVLVPYNRFDPDQGAVLGHINEFAGQINTGVFPETGRKISSHPVAVPAQPVIAPAPMPVTVPQPVVPASQPAAAAIQKPQLAPIKPAAATAEPEILKSRNFKIAIKGLAIGDVTGNGQNEIVFIGDNTVFICRLADGAITQIAKTKGRKQDKYITIDVADINGNGMAEIFVTSLNNGMLNSFVLEWNNGSLRPLVKKAGWYFRVLSVPGSQPLLLGQRRGMGVADANEYELDRSAGLFLAGVHELQWKNGSYEPGPRVNIPKELNLYSFIYGDVANDNTDMTVFFTENDSLRLLDPTGHLVWKSREPYGGSAVYLDYPTGNTSMDRYYLPQRILICDLDRDGKNEVITVKNHETARRFLSRLRNFSNGWIEALAWNKITFTQKWRTNEIPGYISDYAAGDIDHDGQPELIFAVVQKESGFMAGKSSFIIVREISPLTR